MSLSIGGVGIGGENPCRFIVEVSNNHNGDLNRAHRLIDAAKDASAEFIKFQAYTPMELVRLRGDGPAPEPWGSQGHTMRTLYDKARTPLEWFPELFAHARDIGLVPFTSVFGLESLNVARNCDSAAYKIARLDNQNAWLVQAAHAMGKPTIVSIGPNDKRPAVTPGIALFAPEGYPQTAFDFERADTYNENYGTFDQYDGLSFHGTDFTPCIIAASLGATIIEAHMMLAHEPSDLEANVSLTEAQFASMVDQVRKVERLFKKAA